MKPRIAIITLKWLTQIAYYGLSIFSILFFILVTLKVTNIITLPFEKIENMFAYSLKSSISEDKKTIYSPNHKIAYTAIRDQYQLKAKPQTAIGLLSIIMRCAFLFLSVIYIRFFARIFKTITTNAPFNTRIVSYLKGLAFVSFAFEIAGCIEYFAGTYLIQNEFPRMHFKLDYQFGDEIITGLIIWVIAFIYEKGASLQQENELTV